MAGRGDVTITMPDGKEIQVLFTTQALTDAELQLGISILQLPGNIGIRTTAVLLRCGMTAANRANGLRKEAVSLKDANDIIDARGFLPVSKIISQAVSDVIMYDSDESDPN